MKTKLIKLIIFSTVALTFVILSMFQEWELSHETWSYWYFARVFTETWRFVVLQRSPTYILYLQLFNGLSYPLNITLEYIVSTFIAVFSLGLAFTPIIGVPLAFLGSIIWIPYMTVSEPPVQKLALAACSIAIYLRMKNSDRFSIMIFYSLLVLSYLFRPTYLLMIPAYIFYDVWRLIKKGNIIGKKILVLRTDWPLILSIVLIIIFELFQSHNKFNNVFFTSTEWFPHDGKHEEIIQNYNRSYISDKYGSFDGKDFYFTNKELFNGASNSMQAVINNPYFVFGQLKKYIYDAVQMTIKFTIFSKYYINIEFSSVMLFTIFIGSLIGAKKLKLLLFLTGSYLMYGATIAFMPQYRYLIFPIIPMFLLSAYGYSNLIKSLFQKNQLVFTSVLFILIISFSPFFAGIDYYNRTYLGWPDLIKGIIRHYNEGSSKILEVRSSHYASSLKASYPNLSEILSSCNGVISLEYTFLGAYTTIPLEKNYDIWEIPPFGTYNNSSYNGLRPDRINCIFVSRELFLYPGEGTNSKIRYQNYITPYIEKIIELGARRIDIPSYGEVIILDRK